MGVDGLYMFFFKGRGGSVIGLLIREGMEREWMGEGEGEAGQ